MKKTISIILAVMLLLGAVPFAVTSGASAQITQVTFTDAPPTYHDLWDVYGKNEFVVDESSPYTVEKAEFFKADTKEAITQFTLDEECFICLTLSAKEGYAFSGTVSVTIPYFNTESSSLSSQPFPLVDAVVITDDGVNTSTKAEYGVDSSIGSLVVICKVKPVEHYHYYIEGTPSEESFVAPATCLSPALYKKECRYCGEYGTADMTYTSGKKNFTNHASSETYIDDDGNQRASCCNALLKTAEELEEETPLNEYQALFKMIKDLFMDIYNFFKSIFG